MAEVSSPSTFQQSAPMHMSAQEMQNRINAGQAQFNLPQPHLMQSRSTNNGNDNLRKYSNYVHQNQFAGQQINDNSAFQAQQLQDGRNTPASKHQLNKQRSFTGQAEAYLQHKAGSAQKQQFPVFDMTKNFIPRSAPVKVNVSKKENGSNEPLPILDLTKCKQAGLLDYAPATPATRCNTNSHNSSTGSYPNSDLEEVAFDTFIESPNKRLVK